eukprot:3500117-Pyramimonas_sp.AAC.2
MRRPQGGPRSQSQRSGTSHQQKDSRRTTRSGATLLRWLIPLTFLALLRYWKASDLMARHEQSGAVDDIVLFDNEEPQLATFEPPPEEDDRPEVVLQEEEDDNTTEVFNPLLTSLAETLDDDSKCARLILCGSKLDSSAYISGVVSHYFTGI